MKVQNHNNFDLIRLFAASQVVINHVMHHLDLADTTNSTFSRVFNFFPGVPIFFFISGFLISASYARGYDRGGIRQFFINRSLRIFPALWVCFALSVLSVWASGYFQNHSLPLKTFAVWTLSQLTVVQFYNPEFLRGYGVGTLNGSLWTISVELQFYLMTIPLMALLWFSRAGLWIVFAGFAVFNVIFALWIMPTYGGAAWAKLLSVTFLPWIAMFIAGTLAQHYWPHIQNMFSGRFRIWLGIYLVLIIIGILIENATSLRISGNRITPLHYIPLSGLILAAAYTRPSTADLLLKKNDISYGLYIYHMPIINYWIWMQWPASWMAMAVIFGLAVLMAWLSWTIIERPALRLKRSAIFQR